MTILKRITIDIQDLSSSFCIGIAGNFAGHLEQAGEAQSFTEVETSNAAQPKGIFPWYIPQDTTFLGTFPLSNNTLTLPRLDDFDRVQIEPEMGVLCDIIRDFDGRICTLTPRWVGAFDDCSTRNSSPKKISEKKNWGACSKGLSSTVFCVDDLAPTGSLSTLRIASFLQRDGVTHTYGVDSSAAAYSLCGTPLLNWLVDRVHSQKCSENSPLEDVGAIFSTRPEVSTILIGVGATRYEPFGEESFVHEGDESIVVLYDSIEHDATTIYTTIATKRESELNGACVLRRQVIREFR